MSTALQNAIDELETELAGIDDKRSEIEGTIHRLRQLLEHGVTPSGRGRRKVRRPVTALRARAPRSRRAEAATPNADVILASLKRFGGSASPGKLAESLSMDRAALRYQLKPLLRQKIVIATGNTTGRVISLPGKEHL